ncbi:MULTISPECIES: nitrilase-related carbon-nitrogen hydrolase [unclassified Bradyrhizobium]|uniref:nitrilase-related carbon-nitrogen hydrolase n=1 Tax=unclassified Bradyrhizobium TaxID=2631580 RepID=UPI0028EF54DD|nr:MULTISPECIES: nitrilase-related carbon-nitrogen hydrolase [unclassified Bradyrhizobium]
MAADGFRITLAQLNPTVGDIAGNAAKAREVLANAADADLVVLPELFIAGGLAAELTPRIEADCRDAVEALAREAADGGPAMLIGTPWSDNGKLYNALALLDGGRIAATRFKTNLPGDQKRLFARGPAAGPISVRGMRIGVAIGEDIWPEQPSDENVVETLAETGAELVVVAAAARYIRGDGDRRLSAAVARVTESDLPLLWLNQTGGHDGEVFDGASFALNADLSIAAQLPGFVEHVTTLAWRRGDDGWQCRGPVAELIEGDEADYAAHVLRLRDRVAKAGFSDAILGLAAGIESALSLALAVDALGADEVRAVLLAGPDTPQQLRDEAIAFAARLGIAAEIVPIAAAIEGVETILPGPLPVDAHRDLLVRLRSTLLAALANQSGALAVDVSGGIAGRSGIVAALGDIAPAQAARLAALRNRWTPADARGPSGEVISPDLIARAETEG